MSNTVIALKKSATPSAAPASLANGELAINYADGKLYYKHANGTILPFSTGGGGGDSFSTINVNGTLIVADTPGDILTIEAGTNVTITADAINDKITISSSSDISPALIQANTARDHANAAFGTANNALPKAGGTITGDLNISGNFYASAGANSISLTNGTSNWIYWSDAGATAPTFTTRSIGTKLVLYPALSGVQTDYALGIEPATLWSSVPVSSDSFGFRWYGGTTQAAFLSGAGNLTLSGSVNATSILVNNVSIIDGLAPNSYVQTVGTAGNAYSREVGTAGNNYIITVGAAANGWANLISNTRSTASNAYSREVGTAGNNYTITVGAAANGWANTVGVDAKNYANSTFVKLTATSQTITGNVNIVGDLTLSGNTFVIDATRLEVDDPLIYLAANNYASDIVDIGFIANYVNSTGQNVHTGLYREHEDKMYYLFNGYDKEPANNHIGALSNNMTLAVLNADVKTSNLMLGGVNAISWITASFNKANAALPNTSGATFNGVLNITNNVTTQGLNVTSNVINFGSAMSILPNGMIMIFGDINMLT